ncbi:MAG TPA: hypothetical protein VE078_08460 [Thermoanaerobaculia bacterium]|nr:hypothetical protein [Thermoanaerobaculia bacterium]
MRSLRLLTASLLLLACPLAARQEETPPKTSTRSDAYFGRYIVRYLDVYSAQTLAWEQCPKKEECEIKGLSQDRGAVLDVTVDAATHDRLARAFAEHDVPRTQSFQLVVLAASTKPNGDVPALYKGAQKALDDIKGFLPFKSYRILDTALIRVTQFDVAKSQVAGLPPSTYEVLLRFRTAGVEGEKLIIDTFGLKDRKDNNLIQTAFSMDIGETVVVGTSSVDAAQESLVVLMSAMP